MNPLLPSRLSKRAHCLQDNLISGRKLPLGSLLAIALLGLLSGAGKSYAENSALEIVKEGKPQTSIVIPDSPLPVVSYAAEELQYHIQKASGAVVPIVKEKSVQDRPDSKDSGLIYLGGCKSSVQNGLSPQEFTTNSFVIRRIGPSLYIAGDDSPGEVLGYTKTRVGTLFGVYEFLEKQLGVKWLWPGQLGEVIPPAKTISVADWDQKESPRILHNRWREAAEVPGLGWSSAQAQARYQHDERVWLKRQRFTIGVPMDVHHAFTDYWKRFGKTHPEYFNLLPDGTRRPETAPIYVSMCVSQPALWKQIVTDWQKKLWPQNQPWIDASENDVTGKCTCPNCMAMDAKDPELKLPWDQRMEAASDAFKKGDPNWNILLGKLSDRYARFYLDVQKEAEKVNPDAVVMGLAYANYWKPPVETKLNKRIVIALVPAIGFPWTDEKDQDFVKQWEGWAATGASLLLRPNYMLTGHSFPVYFAERIGKQIAFTMNHGLIGTDFDSLNGQWGTQGPDLYVLPRMINHPEQSIETMLDEYYSGFGPAKQEVKAYFNYWKGVSEAVTPEFFKSVGGSWEFYHMAGKIFTPQVMEKGFGLLNAAKKAASGDALASKRVAFLEKGLTNAQLTLNAQAAYEQYKASANLNGFREAIKKLDKFREDCEPDDLANMGYYGFVERWRWPRAALNLKLGQSLGAEWKFSWDPEKKGENEGWWKDGFDDSSWQSNSVTSSWMETALGQAWKEKNNSDYDGVAWYRTTFATSHHPTPTRYFLVFGAVHGPCKIWVNGTLVLDHPCPDINSIRQPFQVEITANARFGQPNTIAVAAQSAYGGGGIYRPVGIYEVEGIGAHEKNLVLDPGFESTEAGASSAWKKSKMTGTCNLSVDENEKFSGKASACITCEATDSATKKSWARWYQSVPVQKDKTYRLITFIKTSPEFNGAVEIWFRGGAGKGQKSASLVASTGGLWRQVVLKDIVPQAEVGSIYLNLMNGTGKVWFGDVELVESGSAPSAP